MAGLTLHPMSAGEILDSSFQLYRRHFAVMFLTGLAGLLPLAVLSAAVAVPVVTSRDPADSVSLVLAITLLLVLVSALVWSALTRQVEQAIAGGSVAMADGFRRALRALLPVVGLSVLAYLLFLAIMLPVAIAAAVAGGIAAVLRLGPVTFAVLVVIAGLVPGVLLLVWWASTVFIALPAMVVERLGPIGALKRAHELAKGARIRIAGLLFIAWLIMTLPAVGVPLAFGLTSPLLAPAAAATVTTTQLYLQQIISLGVGALTIPFFVASLAHLYYDRRIRREGYDMQVASAALTPAS